jgi:hypothetical protein
VQVRAGKGRAVCPGLWPGHQVSPVSCKPFGLLSHFGTVGLLWSTVWLRQGSSLACGGSINSARGMHFAHADASAGACERFDRTASADTCRGFTQ